RGRLRVQAGTAGDASAAADDPARGDSAEATLAVRDVQATRAPGSGEVWLDPQLVQALGVSIGDTVNFGDRAFRLGAVITYEPDRGTGFVNFAPRAMFALDDLAATKLIQPASRVR